MTACETLDARNVVTESQARRPAARILSRTSGSERKKSGGGIFSRKQQSKYYTFVEKRINTETCRYLGYPREESQLRETIFSGHP
jgi:hypothetical protein